MSTTPVRAALVAAALLLCATPAAHGATPVRYQGKETIEPVGLNPAGAEILSSQGKTIVPGAQLLQVFAFRRGTAEGSGALVETAISATRFTISGAFAFPGGTIAAQGLITIGRPYVFAITGGTGRYSRARGSLTLVERSEGKGYLDLRVAS